MASAALEEQREHILWDRWAEAGGPADDLELMRIADTVHISAGVEQKAHDVHSPCAGGKVQRVSVVAGVPRIGISAVLQKHTHGVDVCDREVQTGGAVRCPLPHEASLVHQQIAERRDIAGTTGGEE